MSAIIKKLASIRLAKYGKIWNNHNIGWWAEIYHNRPLHENFGNYMNRIREPINSVLEIGCGAGMYPIENIQLFSGLDYTGIDISQTAIDYCKINSNFKFI